MNHIKTTIAILFLSFGYLLPQPASAQTKDSLTWYTDLKQANEVSKATGKPIFALFTGSDWCIWCKRLQQNVFAKPEFIEWAKKNVVLLELDFPRSKVLPPELRAQNQQLQQQFRIQGYPTVWMFFLTMDEKAKQITIDPLGSCGYPQDPQPGKEQVKFLENANYILQNKKTK